MASAEVNALLVLKMIVSSINTGVVILPSILSRTEVTELQSTLPSWVDSFSLRLKNLWNGRDATLPSGSNVIPRHSRAYSFLNTSLSRM